MEESEKNGFFGADSEESIDFFASSSDGADERQTEETQPSDDIKTAETTEGFYPDGKKEEQSSFVRENNTRENDDTRKIASDSVGDGSDGTDAYAASSAGETVDDILAEIMGDGGFNDDFSGLFARYLGGGKAHEAYPAENDVGQRVEYEAPPAPEEVRQTKKAGFEEKLPEGMRIVYDAAENEARRPEFTSDGEVRYPTMGSGESEERVVFDASWEEQAKKEAAKREARMRDAALKGDSTYVRSFVSGGMPMAKRGSTAERRPAVNPRYIDPLSDDEPVTHRYSPDSVEATKLQERQEEKVSTTDKSDNNSFFQNGFSEKSDNIPTAGGKTDGASSEDGTRKAVSDGSASDSDVGGGKTMIDDAVLDAFARSQKSEADFRAKWKTEIELAERRKRERAAAESKRLAEQRARTERIETEKKALADDLPGIPLEINGTEEAQKTFRSQTDAIKPERDGGQSSGFTFSSGETDEYFGSGKTDVDENDLVEKITVGDIPARSVMSTADRKVKKSFGEKLSFAIKTRFSAEGIRRWAKDVFPQKGDGAQETVRKIVRIASFIALVWASIYLVIYFIKYQQRRHNDRVIEDEIVNTLPSDKVDDAWADIKAKYPDVEFPEGMNVKFANTYAINSDVVGYLRIVGEKTNIGTILLQRKGDDSYYLYRDMYGTKSRYGNPYVKSSSSMAKDGLSQNTIIYGHNTHDGLMFHELENYFRRDGYLDAPIVTLDTLFEQTKWKIFAVILTNSTPEADNGYVFSYLHSTFNSKEHYRSVLDGILERSMIHTGVDVDTNDRILTLYTCYQSIFDGGRLVVFARQLRDGETEAINASKVYYNTGARYPQAYYDKKGLTNPFAPKPETPTKPTPVTPPSTSAVQTESTSAEVVTDENPSSANVTQPPTEPATVKEESTVPTQKPTEGNTAA